MGTKEVRDPAQAGEDAAAPSAVGVRQGPRSGALGEPRRKLPAPEGRITRIHSTLLFSMNELHSAVFQD